MSELLLIWFCCMNYIQDQASKPQGPKVRTLLWRGFRQGFTCFSYIPLIRLLTTSSITHYKSEVSHYSHYVLPISSSYIYRNLTDAVDHLLFHQVNRYMCSLYLTQIAITFISCSFVFLLVLDCIGYSIFVSTLFNQIGNGMCFTSLNHLHVVDGLQL